MPPRNNYKPNPEWVSAAYEVAGFSNIRGLAFAIESTIKLTQGSSLSIHVEPSGLGGLADLAGMVQWKITQIIE